MKKFIKYLGALIDSLIVIAIPVLTVISFYENWVRWYSVSLCVITFFLFIVIFAENNYIRFADEIIKRYQKEEKKRIDDDLEEYDKIVTCKDCAYHVNNESPDNLVICRIHKKYVNKEYFCASGIRRDK